MTHSIPALQIGLAVAALCFDAAASDTSPEQGYVNMQLLQHGALSVHIRVANEASIADERWLALIFKNSGDDPVEIRNARYRIDAHRRDPETGVNIRWGGLGSANTYDLFPEAWKTTPVAPRVVPPVGMHIVDEHVSDYAAVLLRMPPPNGFDVHATIHVHLDLADGEPVATPDSGVNFHFHWRYPKNDEFDVMRVRLEMLLAHTKPSRPTDAYMLGTLLAIPEVGGQTTCQDIIDAIVLRRGHTWDRQTLVRHLADHCSMDEAVIRYYVQQIERRDSHAIRDLYGSNLYHPSFTEPLIRALPSGGVLIVLHRHRDLWRCDPELAQQVFATVSAHERLGLTPPGELAEDRLPYWQMSVRRLAMTGHHSLIPHFASVLDDTRPLPGVTFPFDSAGRPLQLRVCDVALDAILTILDGDHYTAYQDVWRHNLRDVESISRFRDRLIDELKARLSELSR